MSGIYIPGLRVPGENEDELWIAVRSDGTVTFNAECGWTMNKGKAVFVPPHGRLIDADALREDWLENGENEYVYGTNAFLDSLDDAPTIIPASGGNENE